MNSRKFDYIYKVSDEKQPSSVKLNSTEWAVLTQLDGKKTIGEIAEILAMNSAEIILIVDLLEEQKLIENIGTQDTAVEFLSDDFFAEMEQTLIRLIGPVGSIIIDDVLLDLKKDRKSVETDEVSTLVEAISVEIDDESKQLTFQQKMLNLMQNI
jgi:hypothetical protein